MTLRDRVQASLGDAYILERELGGAGMSHVFVADERRLGRRVVIKVLSPELAAGVRADRFAREIKLAAALQQANIVPVHTAGVAAELPYYTMPFVEGQSLRERLASEGALPIRDAVSILRDIARALAFAHAHGVVHRDIKPGNVLLSGGTAVVTDFGIAKALGAARQNPEDDTLTTEGVSLGTPAYMAPEQASADPSADHRVDIYAFGCVAYELLTGQPPFHEGPVHRIIAAHFKDTPAPIGQHHPAVPQAIADLVAQCLSKDPEGRPQSASEVLERLDARASRSAVVQRWSARRTAAVAVGAVLLTAATTYVTLRQPAEPLTFALVPFRNVTHDTALEYRSDGIGDEILNGMARVSGIQVVGRSAALRYKDRPRLALTDVKAMQRELGTRFLVTGSVRQSDDRIIISAQLNDSMARGETWAATFARDAKNFGSITDDIVRSLTDTLRALFPKRVSVRARGASSLGTTNSEALDLYLLGQALLKHRGSGVRQSAAHFERAIALDSSFARAYAALATALQLFPYFEGTPPAEVKDRTIYAARRALSLDSAMAEPHTALGSAYAAEGQWQASDDEFRRAILLEPDDVNARQTFARFLITRGEPAEGITQLRRARDLERVSPINSAWLSYAFFLSGRRDLALAESNRAIQLDSTLLPVTNLCSLLNLAERRPDIARRLMTVTPGVGVMTNAPYIFARLGDSTRAGAMLSTLESHAPPPWFTQVSRATVYLARGDTNGALAALERSARSSGAVWINFIPIADPIYDPVRKNARFTRLLRDANVNLSALNSAVASRPN